MNQKLIYHLDGDTEIHKIFSKCCQMGLGHDYHPFIKIDQFLEAIKNHIPDLCIIDLDLADKEGVGLTVLRAIRNKIGGKMPILIVSHRAGPKEISLSFELGASDYMAKPVDFYLLEEKITYLLKGAEKNSFPLHKIRRPVKGALELKVRPTLIDELYFHFNSGFFVLKNTPVKVSHPIIKKIFERDQMEFIVHDCRLEDSDGSYSLRMIAKNPNDEYFDKIHRFLLLVN